MIRGFLPPVPGSSSAREHPAWNPPSAPDPVSNRSDSPSIKEPFSTCPADPLRSSATRLYVPTYLSHPASSSLSHPLSLLSHPAQFIPPEPDTAGMTATGHRAGMPGRPPSVRLSGKIPAITVTAQGENRHRVPGAHPEGKGVPQESPVRHIDPGAAGAV